MTTTIRAGIAVALLAGFFVITLGIVGGLAVLTVIALAHGRPVAGKLGFATVVVGAAVGTALWKVARLRAEDPGGVPVTPAAAPALWDTVRAMAAEANTRPPDEIRLVAEVNAAVVEHARWLGLLGGRRFLLLGMPLVQAFTVGQLRSLLAHELGHYSHNHTRLGALSYRGRMTVITTIGHLGTRNAVGMLLMGYARLYLLVESAVSRRQELEADRASVRVAGRATAASALRDLPAVAGMWDFYLGSYVGFGWRAGLAPREVFGGFAQLLAARAHDRERFASQDATRHSRYDSHPPIPWRIAAIEAMPDSPVHPEPDPATMLLDDLPSLLADLEQQAVQRDGRAVLPWPQFTLAAARADAEAGRTLLLRAATELSGRADAGVPTALDLLAAGRQPDLGRCLTQWLRMSAEEALVVCVTDTVRLALADAGVAGWRHSWSGPVEFVDHAGEPFPVAELVRLAMDPSTVDELRHRLAALPGSAAAPGTPAGRRAPGPGASVPPAAVPAAAHAVPAAGRAVPAAGRAVPAAGYAVPAGSPAGVPAPAVSAQGAPAPPGADGAPAPAAMPPRYAPADRAPSGHAAATDAGLSVIGGLAGVRLDGYPHDLLITDQGFILIADGDPAGASDPQRLWRLARSADPDTLARRHRFLAYGEISGASVESPEPLSARLALRDGTVVGLVHPPGAATLTDECATTMLEALATVSR